MFQDLDLEAEDSSSKLVEMMDSLKSSVKMLDVPNSSGIMTRQDILASAGVAPLQTVAPPSSPVPEPSADVIQPVEDLEWSPDEEEKLKNDVWEVERSEIKKAEEARGEVTKNVDNVSKINLSAVAEDLVQETDDELVGTQVRIFFPTPSQSKNGCCHDVIINTCLY